MTVSLENLGVQSNIQVIVRLHLFISRKVMHVIIDMVQLEICQYIFAQCVLMSESLSLELGAKVGDSIKSCSLNL